MKKPVIEFQNFSFQYYSQAEPTLKNINLTIYEGEKVLICGPSGSGKSTIGHCINGLIPHSYKGEISGSLNIMGKDASTLNIFERSKMVGTVLQDTDGQFIALTVGEDIAFSLENDCIPQEDMFEIVQDVARLVDMDHYLKQSVHHLSGGQMQRVAVAGVLVNDVEILLFDEPLASLDPATGQHVVGLIDRLQKEMKKTVIIIEHRLEDVLTHPVDRIIVVDHGEIIADMDPHQLLASNLLSKVGIREPLYIKAAKYAGCRITKEMQPGHIDTFHVDACKKPLLQWFRETTLSGPVKTNEPILELKNIFFQYENGAFSLKDVSLSFQNGEMVSIIGKNGAGKSTLSKLICGFERPNSGKIYYAGNDVTADTIAERSRRVGMVLQNPNHMISKHMIFDEVAFGLELRGVPEKERTERVLETLKICGLYPFRNWPISALSYGQKKRVTIASILALEPEVIILDEPTAGQDLRHYTEIMEFLVSLNKKGKTILMVTHDMHLMLEYTPRAIVINDGRVIADDKAVNILYDADLIKKANLKETSLYTLAERLGIPEPTEFVARFIAQDKEEKKKWLHY
ncbi:MAG: ABC transporter ATP-binding protein [Caldibacillus sp.]